MVTEETVLPLELDEEGFLKDPQRWSRELAQELARQSGVGELTPEHWAVLDALRDFYFRNGAPPSVRYACDVNDLDRHCMSELFGTDLVEAWRIAGLPDPGEEAKAYL